jgi:hypothetical protein
VVANGDAGILHSAADDLELDTRREVLERDRPEDRHGMNVVG